MGIGALLNKPCSCGSGKKFKKCCMKAKKYRKVPTVKKILDYGNSDDFVARLMMEVFQIRDAVFEKDTSLITKFDEKYKPILDNLIEMKIVMDKSIELIKKHIDEVSRDHANFFYDNKNLHIYKTIDIDLNILFKDFFIRGRIATTYMNHLSKFLGVETSFMFYTDDAFEKGKAKFLSTYTDENCVKLMKFIELHRGSWYKSFVDLRVDIEHGGFSVPEIAYYLDESDNIVVKIPTINNMEMNEYFNIVWSQMVCLCEDIIVLLLGLKLKPPYRIYHVPEKDRDPSNPAKYVAGIDFGSKAIFNKNN